MTFFKITLQNSSLFGERAQLYNTDVPTWTGLQSDILQVEFYCNVKPLY